MGSIARTFDLISREYHWTDEQILDLTVARFAQINWVLSDRVQAEDRRERQLLSWQTQALAHQLANLSMSEKGGKAMHGLASKMTLALPGEGGSDNSDVGVQSRELPRTEQVALMLGALERGRR